MPTRRRLRIYAYDPVRGRVAGNRIVVDVANESLRPGPVGAKVEIVDYDSTRDVFLPPVDLEDDTSLASLLSAGHSFSQSRALLAAASRGSAEADEALAGLELRSGAEGEGD